MQTPVCMWGFSVVRKSTDKPPAEVWASPWPHLTRAVTQFQPPAINEASAVLTLWRKPHSHVKSTTRVARFHFICTPPVASCSAASAVNQTLLVKVAAVVASDDILCGVYSSACKCFDSILAQIEDLPVFSLLNEKNAPRPISTWPHLSAKLPHEQIKAETTSWRPLLFA